MMPSFNIVPVSPSSVFDLENVNVGLSLLRKQGLNIIETSPQRASELTYLNGSDDERLRELQSAFTTPNCDLIWHARGGYGLTRILASLELPQGPLPKVVGFSDASALLLHLWRHRKAKGIHGPNLDRIGSHISESLDVLAQILNGHARDVNYPRLRKLWWPAATETIEGELVVSNLCVLTHLVGTSSMPDLAGSILVLEEVGERPYRIDRMITQLWNSGSLRSVKAIVLGQFVSCDETDHPELTSEFVMLERCRTLGIPLCAGLPVGHDTPNWAVPFGARARLTASDDVELRILEEIF